MSTKNLARTVIEGGRAPYNRYERWHSNRAERRRAHQHEQALGRAADRDEASFEPRSQVYRGFDDKLGPARRWLRSQVGRPWDKVRSELFARFDARTTAGRHILFDHLLAEVATAPPSRFARRSRFEITQHGLLRYVGRERWPAPSVERRLPEPESVLRAWLGQRRVIQHGERLYWLQLTQYGGFRQERELSSAEATRFTRLPRWFREMFEGPHPPWEQRS